ncbi:Zinc metalloprotease [Marinobacterium lacunae]|uniref:Zinc metalloprotease n=1 Tax=Marinobacterium lacunae TaxID=1232683 RepID=A0A081FV16_9GAMM|nr:SprT family zinc-dependent metalloprotease [Marinobacterium lacunae]KEA62371.1 Zinc metalloprotease [Marinobacterium lacunae]
MTTSDLPFNYQVVRSRRRRTASLMVDMGRVEVRVPALADAHWVERWVRSKADWIMPRLETQTRALEQNEIRIEQNGRFTVDGVACALNWGRGTQTQVHELPCHIQVTLSRRIRKDEQVATREILKRWMVERAEQALTDRCRALGSLTGLNPKQVQVKDYRRKWGQCNAKGEIILNWRLMHLLPAQREYVMIHELCHLSELNHGRRFWALVERHCPDYRQYRESLSVAYPFLMW